MGSNQEEQEEEGGGLLDKVRGGLMKRAVKEPSSQGELKWPSEGDTNSFAVRGILILPFIYSFISYAKYLVRFLKGCLAIFRSLAATLLLLLLQPPLLLLSLLSPLIHSSNTCSSSSNLSLILIISII